jgi:hypothetical protein
MAGRVHYSKSHLSKVETGAKLPSADLARRCDAALHADGALVELVTVPARPTRGADDASMSEEMILGLRSDGRSWVGAVDRREFLAAGAATMVTWMLDPAPAPGQHGAAAVEPFQLMFRELRRLGQSASPSTVVPIVVAAMHALQSMASAAAPVRRSAFLTMAAHFATYAGWMAQESGDPRAATLWTDRAAHLAAAADDAELVAYSYVRRALVALNEHDAVEAIALAERAQATTDSPRVRGLAAQREAQGHAIAGDYRSCRIALDRAAVLLDRARTHGTGPVIGTSTVDDLAAITEGWCLYDLGRCGEAAEILEREVDRIPLAARRTRARYGARLALALANMHEVERACATVEPVLDAVTYTDSATIRLDVRQLARTLNRWHGERAVMEIQPRLAAVLHRPSGPAAPER